MKRSQPSTRASDTAERSPSVYFANLKADMLLQKQLAVIRRAENNLVHSITIDQKILFRRFQAKLRRSKLARAQLYGDKPAERELRSRDLHVLNTNCGQQQDDVEFLKKLQRRPCLADVGQQHKVTQTEASQDSAALIEITDEEMEQYIQAVMEDRVPPVSDKTLRTLQTIGELMEQAKVRPALSAPSTARSRPGGVKSAIPTMGSKAQVTASVRPLTTAGGRTESCKQDPNKGDKSLTSSQGGRKSSASRCVHRSLSKSPYNAKQWNDKKTTASTYNLPKSQLRVRPNTSPATSTLLAGAHRPKGQSKTELTAWHPAPKAATQPVKRLASPGQGGTTGASPTLTLGVIAPSGLVGSDSCVSRRTSATPAVASMFEEEKKVDLVALRLAEARKNDLGPKVMAFLKSLLDLEMKERLRAARRARQAQIAAQIAALGEHPDMDDPQVLYLFSLQGRSLEEVTEVEVADASKAKEPELKGDRKWDYYATKMALQSASAKRDPAIVLPGTPEEVKMRMVGNQNARSITMPTLNFDPEGESAGAGADNFRGGRQPVRWAYEARGLRRQTQADILVVQPELVNRF